MIVHINCKSARFAPDGSHFLTAGLDVTVWNTINGVPLITLAGHQSGAFKATFSADGKSVISSGSDNIRIWDTSLAGLGEVLNFSAHKKGINGIAYSPDGNSIASAGTDGLIKIWESATGALGHRLNAHESEVWSVAYSPDGSRLISTGEDKTWNPKTGKMLFVLEGRGDGIIGNLFEGVLTASFNLDGSLVASAGADGTVRIWDTESGERVQQFIPHPEDVGVTNVQFSPDGQRLAVTTDASLDTDAPPILAIWDMGTRSIIHINDAFNSQRIWGLDYSPDGRFIAIGESGGRLSLYDATTYDLVFELPSHSATIWLGGVHFSPDSSLLLSGSSDGAVKVWRVDDRALSHELPTHPGSVESVMFSPDGQHILTAGQETIVRTFTLDLGELLAIAETRVTRSLTQEECRQYLHLDACPEE